jgi:heptaprenyl diphosphate synthase
VARALKDVDAVSVDGASVALHEADEICDIRFHRALSGSLGSFEHSTRLEAACQASLRGTGKLLRPRILLTMAGAGGAAPLPAGAIDAAVAVELLHLASLAHDDVVDDADIRRHRPAVQATFGATAALLAGGWLFSCGLELASKLGPELAAAYARAAADMCEGQMLEVEDDGDVSRTEDRYFAAVTGKTAALFAWSSRTGASLADLPPSVVEQAARFGTEFGVAYQIVDDLLDITASVEQLGKPVFSDMRSGVYTLPVIRALSDRALVDRMGERLGERDLGLLADLVRASDGVATSCDEARQRLAGAREALTSVPQAGTLEALIEQVEHLLDGISP